MWPPRRRSIAAVCATCCTLVLALSAPFSRASGGAAPAPAKPPSVGRLFGLNALGDPTAGEFQTMAGGGVKSYRTFIAWGLVESRRGRYDWSYYDGLFEHAAEWNIAISPYLYGSPSWVAREARYPPSTSSQLRSWVRFASAAARRYGPNGTFWASHPAIPYLPIHAWQVWNEPSFPYFWPSRDATKYIQFCALTRTAIRAVDPHAEIVLGGLLNLPNRRADVDLGLIYSVPHARRAFDAVAVHIYGVGPPGFLQILRRVRHVMKVVGDGAKPLWIDEFGWATSGPGWVARPPAVQAKYLGQILAAVMHYRTAYRLERIMYFSWRDTPPDPRWELSQHTSDWWGIHTGLIDVFGTPKPAWYTYVHAAHAATG